jgi:hypothetical protein
MSEVENGNFFEKCLGDNFGMVTFGDGLVTVILAKNKKKTQISCGFSW